MLTIYHHPRCSKSREALKILQDRQLAPQIILYLQDPPSVTDLAMICQATGRTPLELMRTGESRFQELGLSRQDTRSESEWLQLMHDNPILIERPIVVNGNQAAVGRPPEAIVEIL